MSGTKICSVWIELEGIAWGLAAAARAGGDDAPIRDLFGQALLELAEMQDASIEGGRFTFTDRAGMRWTGKRGLAPDMNAERENEEPPRRPAFLLTRS